MIKVRLVVRVYKKIVLNIGIENEGEINRFLEMVYSMNIFILDVNVF